MELRGIAGLMQSVRGDIRRNHGEGELENMLATLQQLERDIEAFTRKPWGKNPNAEK